MYFSIWLLLTNVRQPGSVVAFFEVRYFKLFKYDRFLVPVSHIGYSLWQTVATTKHHSLQHK